MHCNGTNLLYVYEWEIKPYRTGGVLAGVWELDT